MNTINEFKTGASLKRAQSSKHWHFLRTLAIGKKAYDGKDPKNSDRGLPPSPLLTGKLSFLRGPSLALIEYADKIGVNIFVF